MNTSRYEKGPRCGVDNCRSRYWHIVNGQRVCQNGHIRVGHVETGEDEDTYVSRGRVLYTRSGLTLRQSQRSEKAANKATRRAQKRVFTGSAKAKAAMYILNEQVRWLINNQNAPKNLAQITKAFFSLLLDDFHREVKKREVQETVGKDFSNTLSFRCHLDDLVMICLLGCMYMKLPIYRLDFSRWIKHGKFPYTGALELVPKRVLLSLSLLDEKELSTGAFGKLGLLSSENVVKCLQTHRIDFPVVTLQPLLFKIVHSLFLPPEVIECASNLLAEIDPYNSFCSFITSTRELDCFGVVFISTKLLFGLDAIERVILEDDDWAKGSVNWSFWATLVERVWCLGEGILCTDPISAVHWDNDRTDGFLTFVSRNFLLDNDSSLKKERNRERFLQLVNTKDFDRDINYPYEKSSEHSDNFLNSHDMSHFDNPNYTKYPESEYLYELNKALTATGSCTLTLQKSRLLNENETDHIPMYPRTDQLITNWSGIDLRPGERYPLFKGKEPSSFLNVLLEAGSCVLGVPYRTIRRRVEDIEFGLANLTNSDFYKVCALQYLKSKRDP